MIRLTINSIPVEIADGSSILHAAESIGIEIPTLCHLKGTQEHPSCMICTVKDQKTGRLYPSCAMPAQDGMEIITDSEEIMAFRKEALELLLSDHVGDCEAPCSLTCPAEMDIPLMNRLIAQGRFNEAHRVVRENIALPLILGYICPAPCEKACKRKPIDSAVSICLLKRSAANESDSYNHPEKLTPASGKKVAIIGTGPAGLSAAFYLLKAGHECVLFDKQAEAGGAMRYQIPEEELPRVILDRELNFLINLGAEFVLETPINLADLKNGLHGKFDAFLIACGQLNQDEMANMHDGEEFEINKDTFETNIQRVFAAGNILKSQKMAVRAAAQGKEAADNICLYLLGKEAGKKLNRFNSVVGQLREEEYVEYLKEAADFDRIEPAKGFIQGLSKDEAIDEAKRCMHCDCRKPESCKLRLYSNLYGADRKHFATGHRKSLVKQDQHGLVIYEPEKCIKCSICIEIAREYSEELGLSFIGRGFDVRVSVPFNQTTLEALRKSALACAEACPTAAISIKSKEEKI